MLILGSAHAEVSVLGSARCKKSTFWEVPRPTPIGNLFWEVEQLIQYSNETVQFKYDITEDINEDIPLKLY